MDFFTPFLDGLSILKIIGKDMQNVFLWGFVGDSGWAIYQKIKNNFTIVGWVSDSHESISIYNYFNMSCLAYSQSDKAVALYPGFYEINFITYMNMVARQGLYRADIHQLANEFAIIYFHLFELLEDRKPDLVIFSNIPHEGADYVLYQLARNRGIKTLILYQSIFPNRFFMSTSMDDFGSFLNSPSLFESGLINIQPGFEQDLFYMSNVSFFSGRPKAQNSYKRMFLKLLGQRGIRHPSLLFEDFGSRLKVSHRERSYRNRLTAFGSKPTSNALRSDSYIYVPLHLQPELTTAALGGFWQDQLSMIEVLAQVIENDDKIYVKENPKQDSYQRDEKFFERLLNIRNVILIDRSFSSLELLRHCKYLSTVTGTAGWEAVKGGKNSLVFGNAWYMTLPGVVRYNKNTTASTLADAFSRSWSFDEFAGSFRSLEEKMGFGVVDSAYEVIVPEYSRDRNASEVAESLRLFVQSKMVNWA